jgi:ABC-type transporter Mla MlaB component
MVSYDGGTRVTLRGNWKLSSVISQIESLSALRQQESGQSEGYRIDCAGIGSIDREGLQVLHVWMQCVRLRGPKPELINLPADMLESIQRLGLERCFSDFLATSMGEAGGASDKFMDRDGMGRSGERSCRSCG